MSGIEALLPIRKMTLFRSLGAVLAVLLFIYPAGLGQSDNPASGSDEKSEAIIRRSIESLGGPSYLNVRTVIGRGFYTAYQEELPQLPTRFLDYISYPDQERTEFIGSGIRIIQANSGATGWIYDGATRRISDMKPAQIQDFKTSMRTSIENLLRGWWRKEGGTLKYVGRREAGLAMRNETVRLTYPDGFWIEFEFGARDGKPAKVIYKRKTQREDTDEFEEILEEDRLAKHITIEGVTAPWVIDHFRNGFQTSRINYESVEYNRTLAPSLFEKPINPKELK